MSDWYNDLNSFLRARFGCRVQKVSLDAGLTCPNRDGTVGRGGCIYCNQKGSGTGAFSAGQSLPEQMERGMAFLGRRYGARKFIAYFQSFSNTYAPAGHLARMYESVLKFPEVVGLAIGTRPDCIDTEKLDLLQTLAKKYMVWLEYGLQSANDRTLQRINRGHSYADFCRAVEMTSGRGILVCAHIILGLPGEGTGDMLNTARRLAALPVQGVKLHLLYVVKETPLHELYLGGEYLPLTLPGYAARVVDFLEELPGNMVIQRLTGDPHRNELVAPLWALEKHAVRQAIEEERLRRGTCQGRNTQFPLYNLN